MLGIATESNVSVRRPFELALPMAYADGNAPMVGDIVKDKMGRRALVTNVRLDSGTPDDDYITVDLNSGDSGIHARAEEFTLVSRELDGNE